MKMLKKSLFVAAALAMLAVAAQAGEIKLYTWPQTTPENIKQELCQIPIYMDVGFWIKCINEDKNKITLTQKDYHTYEGCTTVNFQSNFNAVLSCELLTVAGSNITFKTSGTGKSSCSLEPKTVDGNGVVAPVQVCVTLTEVDYSKVPGGTKNVLVAKCKISVVPNL